MSIPNYGSHMLLEEWIEDVKGGGFIDYDGHGYYATETEMIVEKVVKPSDVLRGTLDKSFSHIVWFNR